MASFEPDSPPYDNMNPPSYQGPDDHQPSSQQQQQQQQQPGQQQAQQQQAQQQQPNAADGTPHRAGPAPSADGRRPPQQQDQPPQQGGPAGPHPPYHHDMSRMHQSFMAGPAPGYGPPYDARRMSYPDPRDGRGDHPPPGMVMYPYTSHAPPMPGHHGWPPMAPPDMYGRHPGVDGMPYGAPRRGDVGDGGAMSAARSTLMGPQAMRHHPAGSYPLRRYDDVSGGMMGPPHSPDSPAGRSDKGKGRDGMDDEHMPLLDKPDKKPAKKTEVACDFCRNRKLKCDGIRPQCGQCQQREQMCHYKDGPPNRRGPGRKNRVSLDTDGNLPPPKPRGTSTKRKLANDGMGGESDPKRRREDDGVVGLGAPVGVGMPPPPPPGMGMMGPPPGHPGQLMYPPP